MFCSTVNSLDIFTVSEKRLLIPFKLCILHDTKSSHASWGSHSETVISHFRALKWPLRTTISSLYSSNMLQKNPQKCCSVLSSTTIHMSCILHITHTYFMIDYHTNTMTLVSNRFVASWRVWRHSRWKIIKRNKTISDLFSVHFSNTSLPANRLRVWLTWECVSSYFVYHCISNNSGCHANVQCTECRVRVALLFSNPSRGNAAVKLVSR